MKRLSSPRLKDPIRPMGRHRGGLEARWARDGEGSDAYDGAGIENYEDPTIGSDRPSEMGGLLLKAENIERLRDLVIVRLEARNVPFRTICKILGMSKSEAQRRFHGIPERVRSYYARVELV